MKQMDISTATELRLENRSSRSKTTTFDLTDTEFGDYLITGNTDPDRLFYKFKAIHVEQELPAFIKILRPECVGTENFSNQFKALVDRLKTIVHSSIVPVIEGGLLYGQHYIVEEQFEGFALGRGLENEHFDHDDKIKVVNQVGSALMALHQEGIIHGEVNPAHVFITVDDLSKLSGFGVPHFMQKYSLNPPILKVEKRRFVAPEVLAGEVSTKASDLYSFASLVGCIFTTEEKWSKSDSRLSGLNLSPKLLSSLQKGMSKDPKHRHASVEDFLTDLNVVFSKSKPQNAKPSQLINSDQSELETMKGLSNDWEGVDDEPAVHHSSETNSKLSIPAEKRSAQEEKKKASKFSLINLSLITVLLIVLVGVGLNVMNHSTVDAETPTASGGLLATEKPADENVSTSEEQQQLPAVREALAESFDLPPAPSLVVDENWPGFLRLVSLPESGVAWKVPAILLFDDETQETKDWITSLEKSAQINELLGTFLKIRQTPNDSATLVERYHVSALPVLVISDSEGQMIARFTPSSTPAEIETTLEFINKGLSKK